MSLVGLLFACGYSEERERREREERWKKIFAEQEEIFKRLTPQEHLAKMKEIKNNRQARERHFNAIPKGTLEHEEALKFLEEENHKKRIEWARKMQNDMLDIGINFEAWTKGKNDTILVYKYLHLTPVRIHRIEKNFRQQDMREIGFKKVILMDGLRREYILWEEEDDYKRRCERCGAIVDIRTCYSQEKLISFGTLKAPVTEYYCDTCKSILSKLGEGAGDVPSHK